MVCWARVMVGGGYSVCGRVDRDEGYTALMSRSTNIAIVGSFELSRARVVGNVVTSSLRKLYGLAERPTRQSPEPRALFLATAVHCLGVCLDWIFSTLRMEVHGDDNYLGILKTCSFHLLNSLSCVGQSYHEIP